MQMSKKKSNSDSWIDDRDDDQDNDRHQDLGNYRHEVQDNDRVKHDDHGLSLIGAGRDEIVVGTGNNDILTGTPRGDTIIGRAGNDRIFGLGGNDNIDGGKGDDLIDGGDGNDRLDGNKGDDVLIGGAGDDYIDGGPKGHDTAVYGGNFADYALSFSAGPEDSEGYRITVVDLREGSPEGTDTLRRIEVIKFADGEYRDGQFHPVGGNTPATIGDPTVPNVAEDLNVTDGGALVATGTISIFDPDLAQSFFLSSVIPAEGNLGTLVLQPDGGYAYSVANSEVQFLGAGDTKVERYTIASADGTTKVVSFTITGSNDAAVIGVPNVSTLTEDLAVDGASLTATGTIAVIDADAGQSEFRTTVVPVGSTLGTLSLNANGNYIYSVANSAVQYLGADAPPRVESFTISSQDGTTRTVSFTIFGANDAAAIGAPTVSAVSEDTNVNADGYLSAAGSIPVFDADSGEAGFQTTVTPVGSTLGALALDASGAYSYTVANNAVQHLGAGATATDAFTVTSIDGTSTDVSFTISGVNDAPVVGAQVVAAREGDAGVSANALATASDADDNTTLSVSAVPAALPAGVSYDPTTRVFSLDANHPAYDHLAAGEHQSVTVNYQVSDGIATTPASIVFDIEGSNDSAVITGLSGPLNYTVGDDPVLVDSTLSVTDADNGLLTGARVYITDGFRAGNDNLGFNTALANDGNDPGFDPNAPGNLQVTGSYDGASGVLSFTGLATLAEYESILESVRFNTSTPGIRTVSYTVNDGSVDSTPVTTSNVSLEDLTTTGFKIPGESAGDKSGGSMRSAGDVNGDGYADLIIGAIGNDTNGANSGMSYVVFGKATPFDDVVPLRSLDGSNGFRLGGVASGDRSGWDTTGVGDVNGDGFDDMITSAIYASPNGPYSGTAYLVFGKATFSDLNLSELDGSNGFRLSGSAAYDFAGIQTNAAGDINGDGFDDFIVGAPYASPNGSYSGAGYVVFGKASFAGELDGNFNLDLGSLNGDQGFSVPGLAAYDYAGTRMDGAGDVNGDGFDDLIISAVGYYAADRGAAYVVFGKAGGFAGELDLSLNGTTVNGSSGFKISGAAVGDNLGWGLSRAGDMNGDGFSDIIVSSARASVNGVTTGAAYVVFGTDQGFPADLDVSALDGQNGFRIVGAAQGSETGFSVRTAGDFNGDGYDDVIVGAPGAKTGELLAGQSYVVFGKAGGFSADMDLSQIGGSDGFRLSGVANGDDSGYSVSTAGDINGDGFDDIAVSSSRASPLDQSTGAPMSGAGETYVVFGATLGATLVGVETYLGGSGNDTLTSIGTALNESFIGGQGDDTIFGNGGLDAYSAGAGNDSIHLGVAGVFGAPASEFVKINGGSGFDTLVLDGSGVTLDLTASGVSGRIHGIERIDLGGGGNTLALDIRDVLNLSDSSNQLYVKGGAGDSVNSPGQGWLPELDGSGKQVQVQDPLDGLLATYISYTPGGAVHTQGMANLLIDVNLLAAGNTSVIG